MKYPAAEKLEIIRLVEQSALPVRRTLEKIGIPRATFYLYGRLSRCKPILNWAAWPVANIYPASPDWVGAPKWGIRSRTPL